MVTKQANKQTEIFLCFLIFREVGEMKKEMQIKS
jgi:hypothetical protein